MGRGGGGAVRRRGDGGGGCCLGLFTPRASGSQLAANCRCLSFLFRASLDKPAARCFPTRRRRVKPTRPRGAITLPPWAGREGLGQSAPSTPTPPSCLSPLPGGLFLCLAWLPTLPYTPPPPPHPYPLPYSLRLLSSFLPWATSQ